MKKFHKIASRGLCDCLFNLKLPGIYLYAEINKLCKFEVLGYLKIHFFGRESADFDYSGSASCFAIFASDSDLEFIH